MKYLIYEVKTGVISRTRGQFLGAFFKITYTAYSILNQS
jgi:hypothetical protein